MLSTHSFKNEIDAFVRSHAREELNGLARALGLDPSKYRTKRDIARAIIESLPSEG
jgi:hypothetical protein